MPTPSRAALLEDAATLDTEGMAGVMVDGEMLPILRHCGPLMQLLAHQADEADCEILWIPAGEE